MENPEQQQQPVTKKAKTEPSTPVKEPLPANSAARDDYNFKQYGPVLTPFNVRPREFAVYKNDLIQKGDEKMDLPLHEWMLLFAARAGKHANPTLFLNQLTNTKFNPTFILPVDAETALFQLLERPENWESFRHMMELYKHKEVSTLADTIQKSAPKWAAQYTDEPAAPPPAEKKTKGSVASVLAQKGAAKK